MLSTQCVICSKPFKWFPFLQDASRIRSAHAQGQTSCFTPSLQFGVKQAGVRPDRSGATWRCVALTQTADLVQLLRTVTILILITCALALLPVKSHIWRPLSQNNNLDRNKIYYKAVWIWYFSLSDVEFAPFVNLRGTVAGVCSLNNSETVLRLFYEKMHDRMIW